MKIFTLCLFYINLACNSYTLAKTPDAFIDQSDSVIIKIESKQKDRFYYPDDFGNVTYLEGESRLVVDKPYFELIDGRYKISYFLKRGEMIRILPQGGFAKFDTGDSIRNQELLFSTEYFKKFEIQFYTGSFYERTFVEQKYIDNPQLRDNLLAKEYEKEIDFLKQYQDKHRLSEAFFSFHTDVIKYKILERKLFLGHLIFPENYVRKIIENAIVSLKRDDLLFLRNYRNASNLLLYDIKKLDHARSYSDIINQTFANDTKDFVSASAVVHSDQELIKLSASEILSITANLLSLSRQSAYKEHVEGIHAFKSLVLTGEQILGSNGKRLNFNQISKGKLTYIDFWASWCKPCMAEMPYSKRLQEKYAEKGINFVYVSIDNNAAAWQRAGKKLGIPQADSYLMPSSSMSAVAKKFDISSIPRYMIMNQDGKIIQENALRPSEFKIRAVFDKMLKN
ncbi:TlpA family protein disulfide reductase [Dyadobacter psychrotolerans]|uniref:TlpA family protein disulfide reductase n=1 Tax=Dyadobacter psychrotolerans TaxID=2541721 RepID=A0A4V2Z448_9BACT|nr:TlpA disulfide reductase family protein [Dyadobacter psychrotolerans]TDE15198.1 TlpA family protein disulfide reductase [Dyadobacter psychrotolerans]